MSKEKADRAGQLARRRQMLVLRSGRLRGQVAEQMQVMQPALVWADRLQDAWIWLRANPLAVAGGVLAVAVWRPRRSLGLALRLWSGWKLLQRARSVGSTASRLF
ncbi:MAG: YqjK family protein [Hydrogenophaga sp.]|uniref:YqjK family protein n=1 Tax=Hydrogenophaga sp. TaxID=1904254 RepID=UPI0025BF12E3|nr:YqjK family protein [Hydrogenophaga sp.]MDO9504711.1 YqjK family protein [Hydrogenophaga sp.]MDP2988212.1 YqjK family protein [Hydrogenophaga sp.]MDP3203480.1 YqjK family protein [Hydrogenophaga sp.]MDP3627501.1 YqjK family protein [Hydrogenophaga sp.]